MAERGYLDSSKMAQVFNLMRSNDLIWPYIVNVYQKGKEPLPFDLLYWNSDSTRMPAANHSFYLRRFYLNNDLAEGRLELGGVKLDLKKIKIPIYTVATREDHIAPARSVFVGAQCFGGPVRFILAGSGHIAGIIAPPAKSRYPHWTDGPPEGELEDWIEQGRGAPGLVVAGLAGVGEEPRQAPGGGARGRRRQARADRGCARQLRAGSNCATGPERLDRHAGMVGGIPARLNDAAFRTGP
jgi:poly(3-hydroxyalkanoate) synthetase